MFLKPYFDYGSKSIFAYFTVVSCLIHLIIIFSVPSVNRLFTSGFDPGKYSKKSGDYVIEIEFESNQEAEEKERDKEIDKEIIKEMEKIMEKFLEKRQVFVDTSDLAVDEEPQVDTDKIGEKGSVAKDMYLGKDGINNEPRLTEHSDLLATAPNELTAVKPEATGFPIEVVENIQPLIEEEEIEDTSEAENSKMVQMGEDVETLPMPLSEFEVQEKLEEAKDTAFEFEKIDVVEHTVEPLLTAQEVKSVDMKESEKKVEEDTDIMVEAFEDNTEAKPVLDEMDETGDLEEIVQEPEMIDDIENKMEVKQEEIGKIAEAVKEYTEIVASSMDKIKEIVEGTELDVSNEIKKEASPSKSQNSIPSGKSIPYFEDDISNAPIRGDESFNIKKHEYASYYKHIRDRITRYWLIQYGTDASIKLTTDDYKPVIVKFKVMPTGRIVNVAIADSAGNELLSSKVQKSIQNTILNRFPDFINEEYINVKFNFYFF